MVYGLWFMVYGLWFMVYGLWFMVSGFWFRVLGLEPPPVLAPLGCRVWGFGADPPVGAREVAAREDLVAHQLHHLPEGRCKATWKKGIQTPVAQGRST